MPTQAQGKSVKSAYPLNIQAEGMLLAEPNKVTEAVSSIRAIISDLHNNFESPSVNKFAFAESSQDIDKLKYFWYLLKQRKAFEQSIADKNGRILSDYLELIGDFFDISSNPSFLECKQNHLNKLLDWLSTSIYEGRRAKAEISKSAKKDSSAAKTHDSAKIVLNFELFKTSLINCLQNLVTSHLKKQDPVSKKNLRSPCLNILTDIWTAFNDFFNDDYTTQFSKTSVIELSNKTVDQLAKIGFPKVWSFKSIGMNTGQTLNVDNSHKTQKVYNDFNRYSNARYEPTYQKPGLQNYQLQPNELNFGLKKQYDFDSKMMP